MYSTSSSYVTTKTSGLSFDAIPLPCPFQRGGQGNFRARHTITPFFQTLETLRSLLHNGPNSTLPASNKVVPAGAGVRDEGVKVAVAVEDDAVRPG